MKTRTLSLALFAAAGLLAQGPRGPQGALAPNRPASNLNMAALQTIHGPVGGIDLALGTQYPVISVNKTLIKIAPAWYLLEANFEIKTGDVLTVVAAPSVLLNDSYLYAVRITRDATNAVIELRDAAGVPLWSRAGAGRGNPGAPRTGAGCVLPASIVTATGTIDKLSAGLGIQHPAMVLNTGGTLVEIELGPERILLQSDLELAVGQTVTVRYGVESCTGDNVALSITAGSATVVLRNDDGTPNWN